MKQVKINLKDSRKECGAKTEIALVLQLPKTVYKNIK